MRLTRVHVDAILEAGRAVEVAGDSANHITRVLRLRVGEVLTLFDGRGGEYEARIGGLRRNAVIVEVGEHSPVERESPLELSLLQGVARGERMDLIVQKATELGVSRIVPLLTERSVVRLDAAQAERKLAHWRAVAIAACEQCGRNRLPAIEAPRALHEVASSPDATRVMLDPEASLPLGELPRGARRVDVLVGPEGGFTELERAVARRAGFEPRRLGPRILRTETAALTAITALQLLAGDLSSMKGQP